MGIQEIAKREALWQVQFVKQLIAVNKTKTFLELYLEELDKTVKAAREARELLSKSVEQKDADAVLAAVEHAVQMWYRARLLSAGLADIAMMELNNLESALKVATIMQKIGMVPKEDEAFSEEEGRKILEMLQNKTNKN